MERRDAGEIHRAVRRAIGLSQRGDIPAADIDRMMWEQISHMAELLEDHEKVVDGLRRELDDANAKILEQQKLIDETNFNEMFAQVDRLRITVRGDEELNFAGLINEVKGLKQVSYGVALAVVVQFGLQLFLAFLG